MIELRERIRAVNRIRIDAGRNRCARVGGRQELRIDNGHALLRNRHETGLIEQALLEVPEEEGSTPHERTAEAAAVLLLVHRQGGARDGIGRIEAVVANEVVERASKRV